LVCGVFSYCLSIENLRIDSGESLLIVAYFFTEFYFF
jgi:hypothetical protein